MADSYLSDAIAELYLADPDRFTARRKELAVAARAAGDRVAARDIAALGKPSRSAWLVNRLARTDPSVPVKLAELGDQLRAGEAALDGASIRKLSASRRELIDSLVRQALAGSTASAAVREEVTDTLNAALADPDVARQVAAGRLVRAAQWAGFSPGVGTALPSASAPAAADRRAAKPAQREKQPPPRDPAARRLQAISAAEQAVTDADQAAQAVASAYRDQQQAVSAAEGQLADDRQRAEAAEQALAEAQRRLAEAQRVLAEASELHQAAEQRTAGTRKALARARRELDETGARLRRAAAAQRQASQALDRLTGDALDG